MGGAVIVTCPDCREVFDDARCWTVCPHNKLMSDENMDQKIKGLALLGKMVVFANQPPGAAPTRVVSVGWNGMVTLDGWAGEFAPHLFVEAQG